MKRRIIFLLGVLISCIISSLNAQKAGPHRCKSVYDKKKERKVYVEADVMPSFPGGDINLARFISKNLEYDLEYFYGTVKISVVVERNGELTQPQIDNEQNQTEKFKIAVEQLIKKMPRWDPGKCNDKRVPVKVIIPITI